MRLGRRADGMWQKRIDKQLHYFGKGTQADALRLLAAFISERNRAEKYEASDDVTVAWVANHFRAARKDNIGPKTLKDYDRAIKDFVALVGRDTLVSNLTADDFDKLRLQWSAKFGVYRQRNNIGAIRTMFRWGVDNLIVRAMPRFGASFRGPKKSEFHSSRRRRTDKRGERKFSTAEMSKFLHRLDRPAVTHVLLALNGGMYSADISDLQWEEVKRRDGQWIIDRRRGKTGVDHRFVLWPETVAALGKTGTGRVFKTSRGGALNTRHGTDMVHLNFARVLIDLGVKRRLGFGSFKHTHISAVNAHPDNVAVRLTRGHEIRDIDQHYDFPSIERLKKVSDFAREQLLLKTLGARLRTFAGALSAHAPVRSRSAAPVPPAGSQR